MDDPHDRATERRQLTVLFCDVVDSAGLSERCDIEDLREILLEFQAISSQCISNAGGSVVNYIGDGIRAGSSASPLASENGGRERRTRPASCCCGQFANSASARRRRSRNRYACGSVCIRAWR